MSDTQPPTITLSGARGEEWERVLGTRTFAILDPYAEERPLEGNQPENELTVMLDVDALTREQQDALIHHFARKSGVPREQVASDVLSRGVPIRLGPDTRIELPPNYTGRRRPVANMPNGPFDLRYFT